MDKKIQKIKSFRYFLLTQIAALSAEELNKIPPGYNNNIIWNLVHMICAQQSICYVRAGQSIMVNDKYFSPYLTNTRPTTFIEQPEIDTIKALFVSSIDELQTGLDKKMFDNYKPSENIFKVYGIEVNNIDDALEFILYHEGFHSGYIISLVRLLACQ